MAKESVTGAPATRRDSGFLLVHPNTLSTISSSGSGDGPPGTNQGTAPEVSTNMTSPPSLSHKEAAPVQGKPETCDMSTQTPERHISFSPKTCAELLYSKALSRDQLIHEYHYFKWRGVRLSTLKIRECSSSDFPPRINGELLIALNNQIYCDFSNTIEDFDIISNSVSYLAEKSMELAQTVGESEKDKSPVTPNSTTPSPTRSAELDPDETAFFSPRSSPKQRLEGDHDTPSSPGPISLPESVCQFIPELPFADLTVENVRETIPFEVTLRGGRKVSYYGPEPYSYGKTTHRSNPYLAGPLFERIFESLTPILGNDFTKENYSCLATLYENGSVGIPHHSDNESQIASDSTIHTISLGGKRTLQFRSTTGLFFEHNVELPHGSVYSMTTASQSAWSHSIVREQSISDPRISLTFRRMRSSDQAETDSTPHPAVERPVTVPPIKPPTPIKPLIAMGTHRRILLLTDSVLKDTPEHIFSRIADGSYRCVKKVNYELANIFNFEPEFKYSDAVVIACGVNDLARYGRRPEVLADMVAQRLATTCGKHKNTTFVFMSILSTGYDWLNTAVSRFNEYMFELAAKVPNLLFFDSHQVILDSSLCRPGARYTVLRRDGDGVHITFEARKLVTNQLVRGIESIAAGREGKHVGSRGWRWPIRQNFVRKSQLTGQVLPVFVQRITR